MDCFSSLTILEFPGRDWNIIANLNFVLIFRHLTILEFPGRDWNIGKELYSIENFVILTILEFPGRDWNIRYHFCIRIVRTLTILEFPGRDWNFCGNISTTSKFSPSYHFRIPWKGLKLASTPILSEKLIAYHFRIPWKGLKQITTMSDCCPYLIFLPF